MSSSEDLDQMPHLVASDLGLLSLHRPVCSKTLDYYSIIKLDFFPVF